MVRGTLFDLKYLLLQIQLLIMIENMKLSERSMQLQVQVVRNQLLTDWS